MSGDGEAERQYSGGMKRRPQPLVPTENLAADADAILQVKFWLTGISPMVWRRVLAPSSFTLRELHGVIQVAIGWEGIHLYDFQLRAAHYGSWEVAAASPNVTLAALRSLCDPAKDIPHCRRFPFAATRRGYPAGVKGGGDLPERLRAGGLSLTDSWRDSGGEGVSPGRAGGVGDGAGLG